MLTPLLKINAIFDSILESQHQGLLVIGDKDNHYNANQVNLLSKSNLKINVIGNTNHSLDHVDYNTKTSIAALSKVMEQLQEIIFVKEV